jgi:hypothetical protein
MPIPPTASPNRLGRHAQRGVLAKFAWRQKL